MNFKGVSQNDGLRLLDEPLPVIEPAARRKRIVVSLCAVAVALLAGAAGAAAFQERSRLVEWPVYGGDPGGMRYSTLTDINRGMAAIRSKKRPRSW